MEDQVVGDREFFEEPEDALGLRVLRVELLVDGGEAFGEYLR